MAHFVAIPPKPDHQVPDPKFRKLVLRDHSGNAALAVWGLPQDGEILSSSDNFVAEPYRKHGLLTYFMMRGLRAGDVIQVFDADGDPQSSQIEISFVATDRDNSNNWGPIRSKHHDKFILHAVGLQQGTFKLAPMDWINAVERTIAEMINNPVGAWLAEHATHKDKAIDIFPYLGAYENANSRINFTAQYWSGNAAGNRGSEVLLHELCHVADGNCREYEQVTTDAISTLFYYDKSDFFSITATNVYSASLAPTRPLRHDHHSDAIMAQPYRSNPEAFYYVNKSNFETLKKKHSGAYNFMKTVSSNWNPFKFAP